MGSTYDPSVCLLTGDASQDLHWEALDLGVIEPRDGYIHAVLVERFYHGESSAEIKDRVTRIWEELEQLADSLADESTVLIVALGDSDSGRHRKSVRRVLDAVFDGVRSGAAAGSAIDLTVNAVELPPKAQLRLVRSRLEQFASGRVPMGTDTVLAYEDILDDSIHTALLTESI